MGFALEIPFHAVSTLFSVAIAYSAVDDAAFAGKNYGFGFEKRTFKDLRVRFRDFGFFDTAHKDVGPWVFSFELFAVWACWPDSFWSFFFCGGKLNRRFDNVFGFHL